MILHGRTRNAILVMPLVRQNINNNSGPGVNIMQLKLLRDQREKGLMSKSISFVLNAQLQFDEEEAAAINKYKIGTEILHHDPSNKKMTITLAELANGKTFECKDISAVLDIQDIVLNACQTAKSYLDACITFGGEEIIEF